jgi:hypothetical protein
MPDEAPLGALAPWQIAWDAARAELTAYHHLLTTQQSLSEREHILPFFRAHPNLACLLGTYHPNIESYDRLGLEVRLAGEYVADIVIGDQTNNALLFVEMEEGGPTSMFAPRRRRGTQWSARLERGFSQIVDWFWLLDDQQSTLRFAAEFGQRPLDAMALLIAGRDSGVTLADRARLAWRSKHVQVAGQRVVCCTFDDVARRLEQRLRVWPQTPTAHRPSG